jgi:hypothetical protein
VEQIEAIELEDYPLESILCLCQAFGIKMAEFYRRVEQLQGPPPWKHQTNAEGSLEGSS